MSEADASRYEIWIQGHLEPRRLGCFANLQISHHPDGETRIEGTLDPSALHGVLNHLYNLGVTLLSVQRLVEPEGNKRPPPQSSPPVVCTPTAFGPRGSEGGNCTNER